MRVKVKGLEPLQQYYIAIDVVPVDSKRYRYGGTGGDTGVTRGCRGAPQAPIESIGVCGCGGQAGTGS